MKKIILLSIIVIASKYAMSQACSSSIPNYMHLDAIARYDSAGFIVPVTTQIDVQVELYNGKPNGSANKVYCEFIISGGSVVIQPNKFGEFSIDFGDPQFICAPSVQMKGVDWLPCDSNLWYRLYYRTTGHPSALIAEGRFSAVPYAFAARVAEKVKNFNIDNPTKDQVITWNGTAWVPQTPSSGSTYTAGSGISINSGVITNTLPSFTGDFDTSNYTGSGSYWGSSSSNQWGGTASGGISNSYAAQSTSSPKILTQGAPSTGYYLIMGHGTAACASSPEMYLYLTNYKTGALIKSVMIGSGPSSGISISSDIQTIAYLNKGEQVELQFAFTQTAGTQAHWGWAGDNVVMIRIK